MTVYIVGRPVDEMKMFLPVYITTHEEKAQKFWDLYTDESIQLMIFSKEWNPEDNNIFFGYFDGVCEEEDEYMCKDNTLYKIWDKWLDMEEDEVQLYLSGDPDNEYKAKIWKL